MESALQLEILRQPKDDACGPTCLQAVYQYYQDPIDLDRVMQEISYLETGGTLAVWLGLHALRRGYDASLYTYNLMVFDPTWFSNPQTCLCDKLRQQFAAKRDRKLLRATEGYIEFIEAGGRVHFEDLTTSLIRRYLAKSVPILTGLSATYLYRAMREFGPAADDDDVRGEPVGHFVVLCGYDRDKREVLVADPMQQNPISPQQKYAVAIDRLICAILLGVLTYDANLLIIEPKKNRILTSHVHLDCCQQSQ